MLDFTYRDIYTYTYMNVYILILLEADVGGFKSRVKIDSLWIKSDSLWDRSIR